MKKITYSIERRINLEEFKSIMQRSKLAERLPMNDSECLNKMLENANIWITAWHDEKLVGMARSFTDFSFVCYLSELVVDVEYQNKGIGKELISRTRNLLGDKCTLRLFATPNTNDYYPKVGFTKNERAWELK